MKKVLIAVFVLLVSVAFVSGAYAQDKPAAEKPKAAAEKPAAEKAEKPAAEKPEAEKAEKPAEKPKPKLPSGFIGKVAALDNMAQTLTVKSAKESVTFSTATPKLKGYKSIEEMKTGDTVAVKYTKTGIMITKIAGAKPEKAKKEKPAAKKSKKFGDVDANKDGKITIEELTVVFINITPEQFKALDKNADGALDKDEYKAVK